MPTVQGLLASAADFSDAGARRDAETLLCHCLGQSRAWLYTWPDNVVATAAAQQFEQLWAQREQGYPVAYLTGMREFWSLTLRVSTATLIPRHETEELVSWALDLCLPFDASVLDLGTGSGAIALALASERPQWQVMGLDVSAAALQVARGNAVALGLRQVMFLASDWYQAVAGQRFHLLVANPPYIDSDDEYLQCGDLRFEPHSALVAARGGLADLARLVAAGAAHLHAGGWLLLEHGYEQGPAVRQMLSDAGFVEVSTRVDLAGHERVSGGCWQMR